MFSLIILYILIYTLFLDALCHQITAVLRIPNVYPGSRIVLLPILHPTSRIRILDLGSLISDPGSKNGGAKKFVCHTFFVASSFTKLKIILFLKCRRKNVGQFSNFYL